MSADDLIHGLDPKKLKTAIKEGGKKGVELAVCGQYVFEFYITQIE